VEVNFNKYNDILLPEKFRLDETVYQFGSDLLSNVRKGEIVKVIAILATTK
jgi:hypothetical protein